MKILKRVVLHLPRVQRRIVIQRESCGAEAIRWNAERRTRTVPVEAPALAGASR